MTETEISQEILFKNYGALNFNINLVIKDKDEIEKYQTEEIKNKVILGDTFRVLKKIDNEIFDMVFIDPPYFLQLQNKELRRWRLK